MRDLLVHLCGANHLNPTQFVLEAADVDGAKIAFKQNTKIGDLKNVEDVVILPKQQQQQQQQPQYQAHGNKNISKYSSVCLWLSPSVCLCVRRKFVVT